MELSHTSILSSTMANVHYTQGLIIDRLHNSQVHVDLLIK